MTSDATPAPGSMTVPPLFGWEGIVVVLVAAVLIGVAYLVLSAMSSASRPSTDWEAWLDGRSRGPRITPTTGGDGGSPVRGEHASRRAARQGSRPRG